MDKLSLTDYIMLAITLLSIIAGYLRGLSRLHPEARKWLKVIGEPFLKDLARKAAALNSLTPAQRRECAVSALNEAVRKSSGVELPASVANYLIEHAYQFVKKEVKK